MTTPAGARMRARASARRSVRRIPAQPWCCAPRRHAPPGCRGHSAICARHRLRACAVESTSWSFFLFTAVSESVCDVACDRSYMCRAPCWGAGV